MGKSVKNNSNLQPKKGKGVLYFGRLGKNMHIVDCIMDQRWSICIKMPDNWVSKGFPTSNKIMTPSILQSLFRNGYSRIV